MSKKNLVISGATRGIGRATVFEFAAHGYNVFFCARTRGDVNALCEWLCGQYPNQKFVGEVVDCSKREEINGWAKSVLGQLDTLDVLVNNAGVYIPGNVVDEAEGNLEVMLQANLMSAYNLSRALLPRMLEQGFGHIFNVCSIAGLKAYPGGGSYSISKYALLGFNDNLRYELMDKRIKVTAVIPGAVYTDSWSGSGVSLERIMEAEDIAKMVYQCTMLSPQAVPEQIVLRPQLGDL